MGLGDVAGAMTPPCARPERRDARGWRVPRSGSVTLGEVAAGLVTPPQPEDGEKERGEEDLDARR